MVEYRKRAIGAGLVLAIAWGCGAGWAQLVKDPTIKNWTSPNGEYAIKVTESTYFIEGFPSSVRTGSQTSVAATHISAAGRTLNQWEWSRGYFPVAAAIVADSGKLVILVKTLGSTPLNPRGEDYSPQPEVVILNNQGKEQATFGAGPWWKALGDDGKVSADKPPTLKLLDKDKTVEITLASGKIVHVNTDSGEFSVIKTPATGPGTASAPSTAPATTRAQ